MQGRFDAHACSVLLHSTLLLHLFYHNISHSMLFTSVHFCSILFYSTLILIYSALLYCISLHSVLLCSSPLRSIFPIIFYSILFYLSTWSRAILFLLHKLIFAQLDKKFLHLLLNTKFVRSEFLIVVNIFVDVTPSSSVDRYRRFVGTFSLHLPSADTGSRIS
jgi:hypothetical protein